MDFKFGKELIKVLYSIADAIKNKKNDGGEGGGGNNSGEGNDDMKLINFANNWLFYDPKETIVPELPSRPSAESIALSEIYNEEDINTIKDIFKRTLDCLEYNEEFRKYVFEDHPLPPVAIFNIGSTNPASIIGASSITNYWFNISGDNHFSFSLQMVFSDSPLTIDLIIDFSDDYLFYDKTTEKYIWEIEGFDVNQLITPETVVRYTNPGYIA